MTIPAEYVQLLRIPVEQIIELPNDEIIDISSIQHGIVFVFAEWSGAAQKSFRTLNVVLAESVELYDHMRLFLANSDGQAIRKFMQSEGDVPSGHGEIYWIREGRVVGKLLSGVAGSSQTIRELTKETFEATR